jgi:hypothetical protein
MASILKVNEIQHTGGTSAITIDNGGRAGFPKARVPSFHIYKSDNLTLANSSVTLVSFNASYFTYDWTLNGDGSVTCGANAAGIYQIHASGRINTATDGNASIKLLLNGTTDSSGIGSQYCYTEYYQGLDITTLYEISAGDVLRVYLTHSTGSDRTAGTFDAGYHLKLMAHRISV